MTAGYYNADGVLRPFPLGRTILTARRELRRPGRLALQLHARLFVLNDDLAYVEVPGGRGYAPEFLMMHDYAFDEFSVPHHVHFYVSVDCPLSIGIFTPDDELVLTGQLSTSVLMEGELTIAPHNIGFQPGRDLDQSFHSWWSAPPGT